jgi:hypothetical protein
MASGLANPSIYEAFVNTSQHIFFTVGVASTQPNPQAVEHPLSAIPDCLFNIFAATLHIWRPSPQSATRGRAMPWWQGTHLTWFMKSCKWKNIYMLYCRQGPQRGVVASKRFFITVIFCEPLTSGTAKIVLLRPHPHATFYLSGRYVNCLKIAHFAEWNWTCLEASLIYQENVPAVLMPATWS